MTQEAPDKQAEIQAHVASILAKVAEGLDGVPEEERFMVSLMSGLSILGFLLACSDEDGRKDLTNMISRMLSGEATEKLAAQMQADEEAEEAAGSPEGENTSVCAVVH